MIYFDSAATTFQKPEAVGCAMQNALAEMSSPGRGGYRSAMLAAETAFQCRCEVAELFNVPSPEQVIFTCNATHALNIAIKSLVPAGGEVVISGYEHNAVTRPLYTLENVSVTVAEAPLFEPDQVMEAFSAAITPDTDVVICNHVSNVFGFVQPIEEIAVLCHSRGVPLIIDASQSAGILPLDFAKLQPAFAAMPGHKGLYGPQGTGVLICGEGIPTKTLIEGGTGSLSLEQEMPPFLPDRLEAGTHNIPGISGLLAGVRFVRQQGVTSICRHECHLAHAAIRGLQEMEGVTVFADRKKISQIGVVSFCHQQKDVETVSQKLAEHDIAVRAGLHCAPLAHRTAGTLETGTIRLSFSDFNRENEVFRFLSVLQRIFREN